MIVQGDLIGRPNTFRESMMRMRSSFVRPEKIGISSVKTPIPLVKAHLTSISFMIFLLSLYEREKN